MGNGNLPYCVRGDFMGGFLIKGLWKERRAIALVCGCRDLERERERERVACRERERERKKERKEEGRRRWGGAPPRVCLLVFSFA